jgi:hypothetical protein
MSGKTLCPSFPLHDRLRSHDDNIRSRIGVDHLLGSHTHCHEATDGPTTSPRMQSANQIYTSFPRTRRRLAPNIKLHLSYIHFTGCSEARQGVISHYELGILKRLGGAV